MSWFAIGALYCAAAVAAGAFGAHGLESRLDPRALGQWKTAASYLTYAGLALLALGAFARSHPASLDGPGWTLALGGAVFSGTVFALALGGPRWLGAVTPLGGAAMIAAFLWLAVATWRG